MTTVSTGQAPRAQGPAVILNHKSGLARATRIKEIFEAHNWPTLVVDDPQRAAWVAGVRRPLVSIVTAGPEPWLTSAVAAVRKATSAPVVLVGELTSAQIIAHLRGGIDLVVSPANSDDEILARIQAVVRRTRTGGAPSVRYLLAAGIHVDLLAEEVTVNDQRVQTSPTEYRLLVLLMRNAGKMVPAAHLLDRVWGWADGDGLNTLRIFVGRLRRKLGDDARHPRYIGSVRGSGYTFLPPVLEQGEERDPGEQTGEQGLFDSLSLLANQLLGCGDAAAAADVIVRSLVGSGAADGAALLRISDGRLKVVSDAGFSDAWEEAMGAGLPLDSAYASVHAAVTGEPAQFTRGGGAAMRHAGTFKLLVGEHFDVGVFLPIHDRQRCWGSLGALRRSTAQFGPVTLAYFRAVLAVFEANLARFGATPEIAPLTLTPVLSTTQGTGTLPTRHGSFSWNSM
jgi:DNA-binding response OmpR family regulator